MFQIDYKHELPSAVKETLKDYKHLESVKRNLYEGNYKKTNAILMRNQKEINVHTDKINEWNTQIDVVKKKKIERLDKMTPSSKLLEVALRVTKASLIALAYTALFLSVIFMPIPLLLEIADQPLQRAVLGNEEYEIMALNFDIPKKNRFISNLKNESELLEKEKEENDKLMKDVGEYVKEGKQKLLKIKEEHDKLLFKDLLKDADIESNGKKNIYKLNIPLDDPNRAERMQRFAKELEPALVKWRNIDHYLNQIEYTENYFKNQVS